MQKSLVRRSLHSLHSLSPGDGEPAGPGLPPRGVRALPVGVPLPAQHHPMRVQLPGTATQQHQLPGALHDQLGAVLRGTAALWRHGDVPGGAAAVPPRQGLPLHLRRVGRVRHVPGDCGGGAGARLADLLQQEAAGPVVHQHAGQEEEVG